MNNANTINAGRTLRASQTFSQIAGESVAVEEIKGTLYGYCTELGALRLFHKYNSPKARAAYSQNLQTWYFSLEQ
jgi:hypothetical protein